jgi:Flp pilus assembly protein TadG
MRMPPKFSNRTSRLGRLNARPWVKDEQGAAAIEFAIVALPFFLFVLGLIGVGLYFFTTSALTSGVEAASRQIRTGQAQEAALNVGQFKNLVCAAAGSYINCAKLSVLIQSGATWTAITPQACVDSNNKQVASTGSASDAVSTYTGGEGKVVLVTLCYQWDLAQSFPFLKLGTNADGSGSAVVQSATAFRTEPYNCVVNPSLCP